MAKVSKIGKVGARYFHVATSMSAKVIEQTGTRNDGKDVWTIKWDNGNVAQNVCLDLPLDPTDETPFDSKLYRPEWKALEE